MLLVDGSSYLYRAYHAMPDLRGPDGFPTGAIHGVLAMMKWLRERYPAEHAVCVFDAKGPTFRDDWYADYKAQRAPMPEALAQQIEPIHEAVRLLGWPVLEVPGIEADDAIGTLARMAAASGHKVLISTGDKDLAQLVTPEVTLINTMAKPPELLDVEAVKAKFGVPPERIVDYLTLVGDTVDNVPGVEKVGPKTAVKWLAEYGSLDGVVAAAGDIKGAIGDNLRKALDWLPTGRKLVTVRTDCDLSAQVPGWPGLDALALREVDRAGLLDFFVRYGFRSLAQGAGSRRAERGDGARGRPRRPADEPDAAPRSCRASTRPCSAGARFEHWLQHIARGRAGGAGHRDRFAGRHARADRRHFLRHAARRRRLRAAAPRLPRRARAAAARRGAGAPDALAAGREPPPSSARTSSTTCMSSPTTASRCRATATTPCCRATCSKRTSRTAWKAWPSATCSRKGLSYEDLCGKGAHQIPFAQVDIDKAAEYSGEDSEMTLQVHRTLWPQIEADAKLRFVYEHIEMPTSQVLQRIERTGVLIDAQLLAQQSKDLGERMVALEQEAYALAGQPFNLGSPKQIGEILFGKLGLPVVKKTASGAPSTDEEVLEKLAEDHPLPQAHARAPQPGQAEGHLHRQAAADGATRHTGRVHTNYAQAVAITGRLASNDPNLQNIPDPHGRRPARARGLRRAGRATSSCRPTTRRSSCASWRTSVPTRALLRAFAEGVDVHRATASEVFAVPVAEVSQRAAALCQDHQLRPDLRHGQLSAWPAPWASSRRRRATTSSATSRALPASSATWTTPACGQGAGLCRDRVRPAPVAAADQRRQRPDAHRRRAPGHQRADAGHGGRPDQAGDDRGAGRARPRDKATRMVMQVHDELVFEVPLAELDWAREAVPRLMAGVAELSVPLLAEVGVGANWDQAH